MRFKEKCFLKTFEYGEKTAEKIDEAVHQLLNRSLEAALHLIQFYRPLMDEAVHILLEKETLDELALKTIWDKHQGKKIASLGLV